MNKVNHPFWVIVNKEISDHVKSWRFIILIGIIALTCMGSLYTALTNISEAIKPNDPDGSFLFLKLFTVSDGTLPSFVLFINFLGPLLENCFLHHYQYLLCSILVESGYSVLTPFPSGSDFCLSICGCLAVF